MPNSYRKKKNWNSVIFTDELTFILGSNKKWLWRKRGENENDNCEQNVKYPPKVMIFTGISKKFNTSIMSLNGSVNSNLRSL